ncbi:hypothetical protein [Priestia megaterium]|uniref:hypothetical protein n=1 Tax=Priestia megaterium TaxID=1404 RepID=UPI00221F5EFE|nr:hypothetical protein [Priestia megaterium]UYV50710.1 hypothetical protein OHU65_13980 [Priestia megaterium]
MKGYELLDYILKSESLDKKCTIKNAGPSQDKTEFHFFKESTIWLNEKTYNGLLPEDYRVATHEAGHLYNNVHHWYWILLFKVLRALCFLSIISLFGSVLIQLWNSYDTLSNKTLYLLMGIFTLLSVVFMIVINVDEELANTCGKKLLNKHFQTASAQYNTTIPIARVLDEYKTSKTNFFQHKYTRMFLIMMVMINGNTYLVTLMLPLDIVLFCIGASSVSVVFIMVKKIL